MDAICCPADIFLPAGFLNEAREKRHIVDAYWQVHKLKKPRMRRRGCPQRLSEPVKCKKPKRYGKAFGSSLSGGILALLWILFGKTHLKVSEKVADLLNTITTLYEQQLYMYENRVTRYLTISSASASLGSGQSSVGKPMRTNLEPSCISAWWMAMQKSNVYLLMPTTKQPIFQRRRGLPSGAWLLSVANSC